MASHVNTAPTHQSQLSKSVCVCVCVEVIFVVICAVSLVRLRVCFHVSPCCALTSDSGQCVLIGLMTAWCIIHHWMESDESMHAYRHAVGEGGIQILYLSKSTKTNCKLLSKYK